MTIAQFARGVALLASFASFARAQDPAALLKSKDPLDRIKAVRQLTSDATPAAEALLRKALDDKDLEVAHLTVKAFADRDKPSDAAIGDLVGVAISYPVRATRLAAAETLKKIAPTAGAKQIAGKLKPKGDERPAIAEALAILAEPGVAKTLEKLLTAEEPTVRGAAIRGIAALDPVAAKPKLEKLLTTGGSTETAAAAAALAATGTRAAFDALLARLSGKLSDVLERRVVAATCDALAGLQSGDRGGALDAIANALAGTANPARAARVLASFVATPAGKGDAARVAKILAEKGLKHADAEARRASVLALGRTGDANSLAALTAVLESDSDAKTRYQAIEASAALDDAKARAAIYTALGKDADAAVREHAAALAGKRHWMDAAQPLRGALEDADWRVMLAAAISLGSIQDPEAIAPLAAIAAKDTVWQRRAGAVAGLGRIGRAEVIAPLIAALADKDPTVKATAHDYLQRLCFESFSAEAAKWEKWWSQNSAKFAFFDRNQRHKDSSDGKYAGADFKSNPYGALTDIDVFVLGAGKDALEQYLTKLTIAHTMTLPGTLKEAGLHPSAVFIANCRGEIQGDDFERVEWFVRSGGYLVATCWALTNTVMKTFPGVIRADRDQANQSAVSAEPGDLSSPLLEHVIHEGTRLLYRLAGYQIIVIDDEERFSVLVDSLEADERWGQGILCGSFQVGHGVVLDSVNHFALQGMTGLNFKTEPERAAFALERLSYSYEKVRELQAAGAFKNDRAAAEACDDQTFMRLIARFVYQKRRFDG
jgi:HEAT repeat protein